MTLSLVLFYCAAAVALAAGAWMVFSRDPRRALRALAAVVGAVAAVELLLLAPSIALAAAVGGGLVIAILTFAAELAGDAPSPPRRLARRVFGLALLAGLTWIFLGTWGRQLAFPGHDLAPGASFGGARQLATALGGELLVLAVALPLLLFAGLVGALSLLDQAERGREPADPGGPR